MANQLKMAIVQTIQALRAQGWSCRRIGRELGIHRETVARQLRLSVAAASPGETVPDSSKPAKAPLGSTAGRSVCEPWRGHILAGLEAGLSAQRVFQDLRSDHAFTGSYYSVRRFVQMLGHSQPLPFRRMECAAGEEVQVDFGTAAPVLTADGKRRRPHVFRIVLSHSRKGYSEASYRQTTEDFIRCLENAFWHFGGVPQRVVIDNLKAAVTQPDWFDPDLSPKLQSFCRHYSTVILPTKSYTPRHKGKIERGIGYVKANALKGRTFQSLEEQNRHLLDWEANVADNRLHGTTCKQVGQAFAEERKALKPLPAERFPFFHEGERGVNRDGHVEVAKAYYSVPPEYLGRRVWVRWDSRLVHVFNHRFDQIAVHVRKEPGRFSTQAMHLASQKISGVERGATWLLNKVRLIGPKSSRWAESMLQQRGIEGVRVLQGLLSLAGRHQAGDLEHACQTALAHGAYRLRILRELLKRRDSAHEQRTFLEEHPLIRPLAEYGQFVAAALHGASLGAWPPGPQGFLRHGRAVEGPDEKETSLEGPGPQGSCGVPPPWSGYPSSGCSPAEPDPVSPDIDSVVHPFPPVAEIRYA